MEALLEYVADLIGYPPDGYMLVDLESFVDVVDLMGGVEFDVPFDMEHLGETDLTTFQIPQGLQRLDGHDALGLVRYRHGYLTQDLGRVEMQREFISACIDQWLNWSNLSKLPEALRTIQADAVTDLSAGNLVWLGLSAWKTGLSRIQSATLPGYWDGRYLLLRAAARGGRRYGQHLLQPLPSALHPRRFPDLYRVRQRQWNFIWIPTATRAARQIPAARSRSCGAMTFWIACRFHTTGWITTPPSIWKPAISWRACWALR